MAEEQADLERLIALAESYEGEKVRIYLLEREGEGRARPASGGSVARGSGPAGVQPDGYEAVLTLDLAEIPELRARFGARMLSLFAPDIEGGDSWDCTRTIAHDQGGPEGGYPIWVVPVDVPADIFDEQVAFEDEEIDEIKTLVFNRPGWVLGRPIYLQEEEGDAEEFLMQLSSTIGGLNLGDLGCLYVFESGCFMQCT